MFAHSYFPQRYYSGHYFPPAAGIPLPEIVERGVHIRRPRKEKKAPPFIIPPSPVPVHERLEALAPPIQMPTPEIRMRETMTDAVDYERIEKLNERDRQIARNNEAILLMML